MSSVLKPNEQDDGLEAAVDQAIAVNLLESEIADLKKAISHAYTRGRFRSYAG
jgi:hypothetical protein